MAVLRDGRKGEQNSHENSTMAMVVFPVMLADPYIISDVSRASPRIYCLYCGFTSVPTFVMRARRRDAIIENFIIIIQNAADSAGKYFYD